MSLMLFVVLGVLLVFMIFNSRRQAKKRQEAEAERQVKMVPGVRVMSRAGLYGTIVEFDAEDLTKPARIEIAEGVVVDLHAHSIELAPEESPDDEASDDDEGADSDLEVESADGTYTLNGEGVEKLPGSEDEDKK
ncbi:preprotein translocase subunit YajC [Microbacterium halotolerans]|uniref:preprotein translocase subunit YajC n=1 Tax=Microbacterium halotolerans TaxID=246613 RepID=UPI0013C301E9|nr:preprotein translocase subunit YajC [Microbacterium halotolerans]